MLFVEPALYLPISHKTVQLVLDATDTDEFLRLTPPELAAILTIQYLPRISTESKPEAAAEQFLAKALTLANKRESKKGPLSFPTEVAQAFDSGAFQAGVALLDPLKICLLDGAHVEERSFLNRDGDWDFNFCQRHAGKQKARDVFEFPVAERRHIQFSDDQCRVAQIVVDGVEDHLHVQGYAGTGKTHLLGALIELLCSKGVSHDAVLVLAYTSQQMRALQQRLPPTVSFRTFAAIANEIIPLDATRPEYRRFRKLSDQHMQFDAAAYASYCSLASVGSLSPSAVARACFETVRSFALSSDQDIAVSHLPTWIDRYGDGRAGLSDRSRNLLVLHAMQLWQAVLAQPIPNIIPIRVYHQLKFIALQGWGLPPRYLYVIIDESHDLKRSMVQILDQSDRPVISLGDEYQSFAGLPPQRRVKTKEITHSVRNGRLMESVVNPIISAHPARTKELFRGNSQLTTKVTYYTGRTIPERPTTILVSDEWGLFEWAHRLADARVRFHLLCPFRDLNVFVQDCIELHDNGTRPRHGKIFRYGSWQAAYAECQNRSSFLFTTERLSKNYDQKTWDGVAAFSGAPAQYMLGRVEDARNMEFERVMLTPDLLDLAWGSDDKSFIRTGTMCYVGTTRARYELFLPKIFRRWIEDIAQ